MKEGLLLAEFYLVLILELPLEEELLLLEEKVVCRLGVGLTVLHLTLRGWLRPLRSRVIVQIFKLHLMCINKCDTTLNTNVYVL